MAKAAARSVKQVARETYIQGFSALFPIPSQLVATTTMKVSERQRARIRHQLRELGRTIWKSTRGTFPVTHFVALIVTNYPTPSLIAETVKPLIDAGTDTSLWPDDDAYHRKSTVYTFVDDPNMSGTWVRIIILPVPAHFQIMVGLSRLAQRLTGQDGYTISFALPPHLWVTSNLTDADILARQKGQRLASATAWGKPGNYGAREKILSTLAGQAQQLWANRPSLPNTIVLAGVAYAPGVKKTQADPDNSAETVTTLLRAGKVTPQLLAYYRYPVDEKTPGYHHIHLTVLPIPDTFNIFYALLACTQYAWQEQETTCGNENVSKH